MKNILMFLLVLNLFGTCFAQGRIDTLYYGKSGSVTQNIVFADYYRVFIHPCDSVELHEFKDFYVSGELKQEGRFLRIDSLADGKFIFDGDIISYYRNGKISEQAHYRDGQMDGEFLMFDEDGSLMVRSFYEKGLLSGTNKAYMKDGSCQICEYSAGVPLYDYYLLSDSAGNVLKFRIADDSQIWESPIEAERFVEYRDGTPWEVYFKNGVTISMSDAVVRDYGKWHKVHLIITNNSVTPIEFIPEINIKACSTNEYGVATDLRVWSYDDYMKKVSRAQTWLAIAMGVSEGVSVASAGYSTSTVSAYSSSGGFSTYYVNTYNPSAAVQANMASQQRIANFGKALDEERNLKQMEYLKTNTIYPGESISGYVHVERVPGKFVELAVCIEGADYKYNWDFDNKNSYLPSDCKK